MFEVHTLDGYRIKIPKGFIVDGQCSRGGSGTVAFWDRKVCIPNSITGYYKSAEEALRGLISAVYSTKSSKVLWDNLGVSISIISGGAASLKKLKFDTAKEHARMKNDDLDIMRALGQTPTVTKFDVITDLAGNPTEIAVQPYPEPKLQKIHTLKVKEPVVDKRYNCRVGLCYVRTVGVFKGKHCVVQSIKSGTTETFVQISWLDCGSPGKMDLKSFLHRWKHENLAIEGRRVYNTVRNYPGAVLFATVVKGDTHYVYVKFDKASTSMRYTCMKFKERFIPAEYKE